MKNAPEKTVDHEAEVQVTHWSLIERAGETDSETGMKAMESLLQTYLPVLEWYLSRHSELDHHRREDLLQGFIATKILNQNILSRADRSRGRFRTFLLGVFQNFIRDELRRAGAARRMPPGGHLLPLEEAVEVSGQNAADMEKELHQAWLRQTIAQATERMRLDCLEQDKDNIWSVFHSRLLAPMLDGEDPEPYGELVERLNLASPSQASNLLITAKRMFIRHLNHVVADTVESQAEVENELRELKKCF